jgi:hypothetical protein
LHEADVQRVGRTAWTIDNKAKNPQLLAACTVPEGFL